MGNRGPPPGSCVGKSGGTRGRGVEGTRQEGLASSDLSNISEVLLPYHKSSFVQRNDTQTLFRAVYGSIRVRQAVGMMFHLQLRAM